MFIHHISFTLAIALCSISSCSSIKLLPVGHHKGEPSSALKALRHVIVHPRRSYDGELPTRLHIPAKPLMPFAPTSDNSAAAVKRTLLGIRQSCPAGYGYCAGMWLHDFRFRPELCNLIYFFKDPADVAPTATARRNVVTTAVAPLLPRPAVSTVAFATMTPNAAKGVAPP